MAVYLRGTSYVVRLWDGSIKIEKSFGDDKALAYAVDKEARRVKRVCKANNFKWRGITKTTILAAKADLLENNKYNEDPDQEFLDQDYYAGIDVKIIAKMLGTNIPDARLMMKGLESTSAKVRGKRHISPSLLGEFIKEKRNTLRYDGTIYNKDPKLDLIIDKCYLSLRKLAINARHGNTQLDYVLNTLNLLTDEIELERKNCLELTRKVFTLEAEYASLKKETKSKPPNKQFPTQGELFDLYKQGVNRV